MDFDYDGFLDLLDIKNGDILDVASDLMSIMVYSRKHKLKFDPSRLIDGLVKRAGKEGTVLIRTFSWDFCNGVPFDVKKSLSRAGSLGNYAMARDDFGRTLHPIYSWAVTGKYSEELLANDNVCAFGEGSIFDFLYSKNARQINLGNISHTAFTIFHHVETIFGVPYRREKFFDGEYICPDGHKENRKYSMCVRPLNIEVSYDPLESKETQAMLIEKGIKKAFYYDGIDVINFDLRRAVDFMLEDFRMNDGRLLIRVGGLLGVNIGEIDYSSAIY